MSGDISKMFREVELHHDDFDLHRFLYMEASGKIVDCSVTTSPFLATQVLRQLALDYATAYSIASALIQQAFYVDDCSTGADNLDDAKAIRKELNQLLSKGCMTLRKWRSSSVQLLESIPEELREKSNLHIIPAPGDCGKALRIHWDTDKDFLHVTTHEFKTNQPVCFIHYCKDI